MDTMKSKSSFLSAEDRSSGQLIWSKLYPGPVIALLLVAIGILLTIVVMQRGGDNETTFRASGYRGISNGPLEVNPTIVREDGAWVLKNPQHSSLEFTPMKGSDGSKGEVVSTPGPRVPGQFEITGKSRIKFDFEQVPPFWEVRGHALEFAFFVTAEDQLILIAPSDEAGDMLKGQVYIFQWEARPAGL